MIRSNDWNFNLIRVYNLIFFFFSMTTSKVAMNALFLIISVKMFLSFVCFLSCWVGSFVYHKSALFQVFLGREFASKSQGLLEVIRAPNLWLITTVQHKMLRQTALRAAGINSETWRRAVSILPPWWVQPLCLWHEKQCAF